MLEIILFILSLICICYCFTVVLELKELDNGYKLIIFFGFISYIAFNSIITNDNYELKHENNKLKKELIKNK